MPCHSTVDNVVRRWHVVFVDVHRLIYKYIPGNKGKKNIPEPKRRVVWALSSSQFLGAMPLPSCHHKEPIMATICCPIICRWRVIVVETRKMICVVGIDYPISLTI